MRDSVHALDLVETEPTWPDELFQPLKAEDLMGWTDLYMIEFERVAEDGPPRMRAIILAGGPLNSSVNYGDRQEYIYIGSGRRVSEALAALCLLSGILYRGPEDALLLKEGGAVVQPYHRLDQWFGDCEVKTLWANLR